MATTFELISSSVLTGSQASVTFSAIPSTFTDLCVKVSARTDTGTQNIGNITFNGGSVTSTSNSVTRILGSGSSASSTAYTTSSGGAGNFFGYFDGVSATANTFANGEVYIPSYNAAQYKPISIFNAHENNATAAYINASAMLYNATTQITSITIWGDGTSNLVAGSSFYLYGVKNA